MKTINNSLLLLLLLVFAFHVSADALPGNQNGAREIVILYTNDEHGWMEADQTHGGAAQLKTGWQESAAASLPGHHCLILSGGDMWTGPAISTLSAGRAMVAVMNAMGYQAAAIGNHEFDFGLDTLRRRLSEMDFPLLAANVHYKKDGNLPGFVQPYKIIEINGVSIGIIGLASSITPFTTRSTIVSGLEFTDYAQALEKYVPLLRAKGAELLIVIGHICHDDMTLLAPLAARLGITVMGGGHCHELINEQQDGVALIESGAEWQNYIQVEILFDNSADTVMSLTTHSYANESARTDPEITDLVNTWHRRLDHRLSQSIGYASREINRNSPEMQNMITDSWLFTHPRAQIALTNSGGIRQSIPAGKITIETIYGLLPFDNHILELHLRGDELIESLHHSIVAAGIRSIEKRLLDNGRYISPDSTYIVLINDFMYTHPDMNFRKYDENPNDLQINYRQPLIDWLMKIETTRFNPLNRYLDRRKR